MEENKSLITLAEYRRRNGLKQTDLAKIFGTSGSYVSMVETGGAKLSRKSLEKFWGTEGIVKEGLVPAYDRLVQLASALHKQGLYSLFSLYGEEGGYYEPFEDWLTRDTVLSIKYGISDITDAIVNTLKENFTSRINKDWLLRGVGEMFIDDSCERVLSSVGKILDDMGICKGRIEEIERKLDSIMEQQDKIISMLNNLP